MPSTGPYIFSLQSFLVLNIGDSYFEFVSYFVFRASNFVQLFSPRNGKTYPGLSLKAMGLTKTNPSSFRQVHPSKYLLFDKRV